MENILKRILELKEYASCYGGNGNCKKCFGNWDCGGSCHDNAKMLLQDICKDIEEILNGNVDTMKSDFIRRVNYER